jgi:hypothetical protein
MSHSSQIVVNTGIFRRLSLAAEDQGPILRPKYGGDELNLTDLLPLSGVPRSGAPENYEEPWCGTDNLADYRKRKGHPLYGENDIVYRYNSRGYRCPEFDIEAQVRVVSIGCSYTFGMGVPQNATFHELFADRLRLELGCTVVNWNLGRPGASNDYISRVLQLATSELKPDLVLILFSHLERREYVTARGHWWSYNPAYQPAEPAIREVFAHFGALSSALDDELNFFRNYKSIESLLGDRLWLFSLLDDPSSWRVVLGHLDCAHQAVAGVRRLDKARDNAHFGPRSHALLYEGFWDKFVEGRGLDKLRHGISLRSRHKT